MPTTGKVKSVTSKPVKAFVVVTDPGPPEVTVLFNDAVTSDDLVVVAAALAKGGNVSVDGTPPQCVSVTAS